MYRRVESNADVEKHTSFTSSQKINKNKIKQIKINIKNKIKIK